jgi:AraC family transcriptional regulator of adaptative response/methylated-DNA-[protein]-cysteine methyltransferase
MVRSVCRIIDEDPASAPGLETLATSVGVSAGHLQRTFKRIVGITPREYAEARRLNLLKTDLRTKRTVTEAQFQAGFGSSSRLYERSSKQLGMTPATYRRGGAGAQISFAITTCSMGHLLVAATERGICSVKLGDQEHELETQLRNEFAAGEIRRDDAGLAEWIAAVAGMVEAGRAVADLPLDVVATAFQWRV